MFVCISPWNFPLAIFAGQVVAADLVTMAKGLGAGMPIGAVIAAAMPSNSTVPAKP